jgi:hypothetical protein
MLKELTSSRVMEVSKETIYMQSLLVFLEEQKS